MSVLGKGPCNYIKAVQDVQMRESVLYITKVAQLFFFSINVHLTMQLFFFLW